MTGQSCDRLVTHGNLVVSTATSFNLPEGKRTMICSVAIAKLAEALFDQASINCAANPGLHGEAFTSTLINQSVDLLKNGIGVNSSVSSQ